MATKSKGPTDENLIQLLTTLKLPRIREIIQEELERAEKDGPSYSDFLAKLLREECQDKQQRSTEYRIAQAKIKEKLPLSTFPFSKQPTVKRAVILQLAELNFIAKNENIVFIGPAGVGKTALASGILIKALEQGYSGRCIMAQNLFDDMYASLADRATTNLIRCLSKLDVLLIDELGYLNLKPEQVNIFFRLMEERYNRKSTIITTNLEYADWYKLFGNKHMVEALLDRLRHHCHTIRIEGSSLREPSG